VGYGEQGIALAPPLAMPSRVVHSLTRDGSPPAESEYSFVSAESVSAETETLLGPDKGSRKNQSALKSPSSPNRSVAPVSPATLTSSPNHNQTASDISIRKQIVPSLSSSRRLTASLSPPVGSYFTHQPDASDADPRSPQTRKPPASRSSHGIETKSGPPPALSTQRSYAEPFRRTPSSAEARAIHPPLKLPSNQSNSIDSVVKLPQEITNDAARPWRPKPARSVHSRPATSDGVMTAMEARNYRRSESDDGRDSTLRIGGQNRQRESYTEDAHSQEQLQSSNEDLFLNLARDDSVADEPLSRSERRRSRIGTSSFSQTRTSRPSSSGRPNTSGGNFGGHKVPENQNHSYDTSFDPSVPRSPGKHSLASLRDFSSKTRPYAASAHPLDQRNRTQNTRSSFGARLESANDEGWRKTPMPYGRRSSIRGPSRGFDTPNHKHPNPPYTPDGDYGSSPHRFSPAYGHEAVRTIPAEGTESTVSTTAPSTVWDELDDLKSRLRKLELTGLLPKSSNAAMSTVNDDRPPTATTTVTTVSSSPKRRQIGSISPEASTMKSLGLTSLHPLLHSALATAKPIVKPNLYRALEATASDALILAAMTGSTDPQGASPGQASVAGPASGVDRQLRRKADSMCRSLTELCIALAEGLPETEASNRQSEDIDTASKEVALPHPKLLRGASDESEPRTSSRVMSRLEARRTSLLGSSPLNGRRGSPQEAATPTQASTPISSRLERNSSILLRDRPTGEEVDTASGRRPPSRALTEVGQMRPSPQTRIFREYTSQHPLPGSPQQSPSTQSSLPARKSYFTSTTSSPLTPTVQPGNRRYLDRSTPPSSADSARLAEARQRRIASLGQGQSRIGLSSGRLRQSESEQQR